MAPTSVTVWSDYVCPWCYIGLGELESIREELELQVEWRPFLLRPDAPETGWPLPDRIKQFWADPNNTLLARAKKLGLPIQQGPVVPNSWRAHECTEFARANGKVDAFHHALLKAYWATGADLHDWAVLGRIATEVGLDAKAMQAEVDAGRWKDAVTTSLQQASEVGVNAVPTFLVGDRFLIQGAQEAGVFRQALERLRAGF